MGQRTYHDPLHHGIKLDDKYPEEAMIMKLIDSPAFQRLRRVRQLGPAFLTFHGAESSRFTHSLGVFHIARRAFNSLSSSNPGLEKYRAVLFGAALLHDLGHSPLSHTGEEIFGLRHESWSAEIIKNHPSIRDPLEEYSEGTANAIANIIGTINTEKNIIKSLVSSQLDCDRLDYLLRDSHSTGTRYGQLDLERILSALAIAPDGDLAIHPKGLMAVEHYLIVRNLMYRSVYNHRINEVCSWILEQLIKTARLLGPKKVWADKYMSKWLWKNDEIDIETFLANDDIRTGYHFLRWKDEGPERLSKFCECFLDRNLLKAISIEHLSNEKKLEALAIARNLSEKIGSDPDLFCGLRQQKHHGYHPYKGGLRLWDGEKLMAIEEASPLIRSLIKPFGESWLIYPKEIHTKLKASLSS